MVHLKPSLVCWTENENDASRAFQTVASEFDGDGSRVNRAELSALTSWTGPYLQRASEASLTVLRGERGAVHRLALGRSSALGVGLRVVAGDAAAKAGPQLQTPHVADHSRRIKGLLWGESVNRRVWHQRQILLHVFATLKKPFSDMTSRGCVENYDQTFSGGFLSNTNNAGGDSPLICVHNKAEAESYVLILLLFVYSTSTPTSTLITRDSLDTFACVF